MKRLTQLTLALTAAVTLACGGNDRAADRNAAPGSGTPGAAATSGSADIDKDFVEEMTSDGSAEIELGQMAQQRASNPQVREFGQMMVRDHQQAGTELRALANKHNLQISTELDNDHKDLRERLSKLSGAEFDRAYIDAMVDDHKEAVDSVREKADDAKNPEVKQWAAKTLPTLQQHLDHARQLQDSLKNAGGNR